MQELEQAMLFHREGKLAEAEQLYQIILARDPTSGDALRLLALIYANTNRDQEAEQLLLKVLLIHPGFVEALIDLGNVYLKNNKLDAALIHFNNAIASDPKNAMAHYNAGVVYFQQENFTQAVQCYQNAVALNPHYIEAYNNLGNTYQKIGDTPRALSFYLTALQLKPDDVLTQYNLARCYQILTQFSQAIFLYENILKQQPQFIAGYINLAALYETTQQVPQALDCLLAAQKIQPNNITVLCKLALAKLNAGDWENIETLLQLREQLVSSKKNHGEIISPFGFMVHCDSSRLQQLCAMQWSHYHYAHFAKQHSARHWQFDRQQKIKIGYLSADFHHHPSAFIAAELFGRHDRNQFEIHAYSYGEDDHSVIRQRIETAVDYFNDISTLSVYDCAEKIFRDNINVLIDFTGLSNRSTVEILALRPAPIQIHYLGYPGTLGTDFIDYYISDEFLITPESEQYYCEKIVRLPYRINDRQRLVSDKKYTKKECGLPENSIVLCCHNVARKILPQQFELWCEILRATPQTVLWLFEDNALAKNNLQCYADKLGIVAERLIFASRVSYDIYLARLAVADLFLDTYPYNAHSTAHDALWSGVPLITLCGETLVSRVGATLLKTMNLENLITYSRTQYREKAIELITHPETLVEIKQYLLAHRSDFPLFDSAKTVSALEQLYLQMWEQFKNTVLTL